MLRERTGRTANIPISCPELPISRIVQILMAPTRWTDDIGRGLTNWMEAAQKNGSN